MLNLKCTNCGANFTAQRKSASFCSDKCRKNHFQKLDRKVHVRNAKCSKSEKRDQRELFDSNLRISELYYSTEPKFRSEIILSLIRSARSGDGKSRRILCNQIFLKAQRWVEPHKCWRHNPTMAQVAHRLSKSLLDVGIKQVVHGPPVWLVRLEQSAPHVLSDATLDTQMSPAPPTNTIVLPANLGLSPLTFRAYELACASAGVSVVRTVKRELTQDIIVAACA